MKSLQTLIRGGLGALFLLLAEIEIAWPQATTSVPERSATYGFLAFAVVVGLLVVVGLGVKLYDVKRKREDEGVALQSRLSDTLLTDPMLAGLPITATVHMPFRRSAPAVITVTGAVSSPALREAALALMAREADALHGNQEIEDRLIVDPLIMRRAA
jgi:hypothetical protein